MAAAAALQLLLRDCGLSSRLATLRAHFLMGRGDYAQYLMDIADDELRKCAGQVSITRLQSLLELGACRKARHWHRAVFLVLGFISRCK